MDGIGIYIFLAVIIYGMNVVPAFMPPTWIVLVFFNLHYHLGIIPVVLIGALWATFGRVTLYYIAKYHFRQFFSPKSLKNYEALHVFFKKRRKISIPLLLLYAYLPVPSNQVYIAAGIARVNIQFFAAIFLIGRLISYSFWVTSTHFVAKDLSGIFGNYYSHIGALIVDIVGFFVLYLIGKISWDRLLRIRKR